MMYCLAQDIACVACTYTLACAGDQLRMFALGPYGPLNRMEWHKAAVASGVTPQQNGTLPASTLHRFMNRHERKFTGMLLGGICGCRSSKAPPCNNGNQAYSFGVREVLYKNLHGNPSYWINMSAPDQSVAFMQSRYCFSPTGVAACSCLLMLERSGCG